MGSARPIDKPRFLTWVDINLKLQGVNENVFKTPNLSYCGEKVEPLAWSGESPEDLEEVDLPRTMRALAIDFK